jgi:pimeloyl-ACP methyl ester carboxylesterase
MSVSFKERADMRARPFSPSTIHTPLGLIEYASYGEGPTVIALHGGMGGYDQSLLLAQAAIPGSNFRVLAISRPGYLGTPLASGRTPEEQADLCAALLDVLRIDQAGVVAVSAGGPGALQFALRHSERCWGLTMVSACSGHFDTQPEVPRRLAAMKALARIPFATAIVRWHVRHAPQAAARRSIADPELRARTLQHPQAGPLMSALSSSVLDRLSKRLPGTANDIAQLAAANVYPLAQIAAPVLVIHGTGDRVVPFSHGLAVANSVPSAELMAIEGGEHVCLFTHLDEIRARVQAFLVSAKPRGAVSTLHNPSDRRLKSEGL